MTENPNPEKPEFTEAQSKWLVGLRSGNYKQSTNFLRDGKGHCCLGVGCEVLDPNGWHPIGGFGRQELDPNGWHPIGGFGRQELIDRGGVVYKHALGHEFDPGRLSEGACEKLGITFNFMIDLTSMNDCGRDFVYIANAIETHIRELAVK